MAGRSPALDLKEPDSAVRCVGCVGTAVWAPVWVLFCRRRVAWNLCPERRGATSGCAIGEARTPRTLFPVLVFCAGCRHARV
jgi:hypothetical protein